MYCYNGRVLRLNLSTKTASVEPLNMDYVKEYLGGRGLATRMLFDEIDPKVDPMSVDNKVIIVSGPLTATKVATGTRYMVVTKSPLNNMIACSNSGGIWGSMMKYAGYDAIIIEGEADDKTYVEINDDQISFKDANQLWGLTSVETEEALKGEDQDSSVLCIGPGGENLSMMAAVMNDGDRAAGRSGVGAVLGVKNLKAIVVKTSNRKMPLFDEDLFKQRAIEVAKTIRANDFLGRSMPKYGTAAVINILNSVGSLPTNNWQESYFEEADDISGETMSEEYLVRNTYCHNCVIGCGRLVKMGDKEVGGPEYETLWGFGSDVGVDDLEKIIEGNFWCNEMGMDTISVAGTIAAGMELYEKGYIKEEDCDGVPLIFGDGDAVVEWIKRIGHCSNPLAKLMSKGSYALCDYYGVPELSMSVKKLELPAYDARGIQGIGLSYATNNRGGCHVRGYTISPEVYGVEHPMDRTSVEGKAELVIGAQDVTAILDSSGMCLFTIFALGPADYAAIVSAASGNEISEAEIVEIGERIYNIERLFNQRAGMLSEDDTLPQRILKDAIKNDLSDGLVNRLDEMLPKYYELRGWKNAFPTEETLDRLKIKF